MCNKFSLQSTTKKELYIRCKQHPFSDNKRIQVKEWVDKITTTNERKEEVEKKSVILSLTKYKLIFKK